MITPFQAMQHAVDIVNTSEHNKNKVAACIVSGDQYIAKTNYRPEILKQHFDAKDRIGSSSQFIHAEVACIFNAPFPTDGASIFITDPMCPNCAKAICETGIKHVYIDHKGMEKDFFLRRKDAFEQISVPLMEHAGIGVSIIYRKEKIIEPILTPYHYDEHHDEIINTESNLTILLQDKMKTSTDRSFALCKTDNGTLYIPEIAHDITHSNKKYRDDISPLNRLLFHTKRHGYDIQNMSIACNLYPSSRDIVNAIGFGVKKIIIGSQVPDHDINGLEATSKLKKFDVLNIHELY
jgi:deoxycytidylate deaminase